MVRSRDYYESDFVLLNFLCFVLYCLFPVWLYCWVMVHNQHTFYAISFYFILFVKFNVTTRVGSNFLRLQSDLHNLILFVRRKRERLFL